MILNYGRLSVILLHSLLIARVKLKQIFKKSQMFSNVSLLSRAAFWVGATFYADFNCKFSLTTAEF